MPIKVEIAPAELIDKLTILEIKLERIADPDKLRNVRVEYDLLRQVSDAEITPSEQLAALTARLKEINARQWSIEDDIRDLERAKSFGAEFVALARSAYRTNDERAATKRLINELLNSAILEEKSYSAY
jgi:adenine C2-methylase RlmN of 23S rRNA A2503 and tRNA A37